MGLDLVKFILTLALLAFLSVAFGKFLVLTETRPFYAIVQFAMRRTRHHAEFVTFCVGWFLYLTLGIGFGLGLFYAFDLDLLSYLTFDTRHIPLFALGFFAQLGVGALLQDLALLLRPGTNWATASLDIPWLSKVVQLPGAMPVVVTGTAAFGEELFFRGALFLVLSTQFPELGTVWPIAICTILFVIQQAVQTKAFDQVLLISIASVAVSSVGCLLVMVTNSLLPALACHMTYAAFFIQMARLQRRIPRPPRAADSAARGAVEAF